MDASVPPTGGEPGPMEPPRAFATGYKPNSGDMMVYGGGAMTIVGVLATVLNAEPAFLLASLAGTGSAFYYTPVLDTRTPQLGASADGIYVARIGIIAWPAVQRLHVRRQALRTMNLAWLEIDLDPALPDALAAAETVPLAQRFTARNAKTNGQRVEVTLHTLAMPPDAIEARLKALRPPA